MRTFFIPCKPYRSGPGRNGPSLVCVQQTTMNTEEIERIFIRAGWKVPGLTRYPLVGNAGDLSITAHEQYAAAADDPVFELVDSRRVMSYWVRVVPTPHVAAVLIENHGGPPEEERGNPYKGGV